MRLVVLPFTRREVLIRVAKPSFLALLISSAVHSVLYHLFNAGSEHFFYVLGAAGAGVALYLTSHYRRLKSYVSEVLNSNLSGIGALYTWGFYNDDYYGYKEYDYVEYLTAGTQLKVEPGVYHIDLAGCVRVPVASVNKGRRPEMFVAVLDPNKACSLKGVTYARFGNNYAKATFTPTAPGRVKIKMECNFNEDMTAKLYLSCYKVMECKTSGVFEEEIDLRGIREPIVFVADNKEQLRTISRYVNTSIAGLCCGTPVKLDLCKKDECVSWPSFVKPHTFSQKLKLPDCEIYNKNCRSALCSNVCERLLGGYMESYREKPVYNFDL